ncbi:MAG: VacJ family lipoprotein [Thiotrichaceae bacterium]|nr:VacJ family lipoprotein [Thiotrichaceae bacterium]
MNIHLFYRSIIVIMLSLLVACAGTDKLKESNAEDPHEGFNRGMYGFNNRVDTYVSSPLVTVYQWVIPGLLRTSVANFFTNLKEPRTVINDGLQGKEKQAGDDFERFVINTLLGLGGMINVASYAEIEYHEEDFSQTLAVWGVPRGEYLVLPLLGPSSYRGIPGLMVDAASSPVSYVIWPIQVLDLLNTRSNAAQSLQFIDEAAVDPYVFMRASYVQWRDYQVTEGTNVSENLLIFELDDAFDDEELELLDDELDIKL